MILYNNKNHINQRLVKVSNPKQKRSKRVNIMDDHRANCDLLTVGDHKKITYSATSPLRYQYILIKNNHLFLFDLDRTHVVFNICKHSKYMQYVRIKKGLNLKKLLIDQMDIDDLLVITSSLQEVFTLYKELNGQRQ
jgi:hypothetical protein